MPLCGRLIQPHPLYPLPAVQDAVTYLVAAWCAQQVPRELGAPDAAARQLKKHASMRQVEMAGLLGPAAHEPASRAAEAAEGGHGHAAAAAGLTHAEHRHHPHDQGAAAWEPASPEAGAQSEHELLNGGGLGQGPAGNGAGGGLLAAGAAALAEGWRATREGWDYITARHNSEVRALVLMKCAAALTWGAVDVLNGAWLALGAVGWWGCTWWVGVWLATQRSHARINRCVLLPPSPPSPRSPLQPDAGHAGAGRLEHHAGPHLCSGWVLALRGRSAALHPQQVEVLLRSRAALGPLHMPP